MCRRGQSQGRTSRPGAVIAIVATFRCAHSRPTSSTCCWLRAQRGPQTGQPRDLHELFQTVARGQRPSDGTGPTPNPCSSGKTSGSRERAARSPSDVLTMPSDATSSVPSGRRAAAQGSSRQPAPTPKAPICRDSLRCDRKPGPPRPAKTFAGEVSGVLSKDPRYTRALSRRAKSSSRRSPRPCSRAPDPHTTAATESRPPAHTWPLRPRANTHDRQSRVRAGCEARFPLRDQAARRAPRS